MAELHSNGGHACGAVLAFQGWTGAPVPRSTMGRMAWSLAAILGNRGMLNSRVISEADRELEGSPEMWA